MAGKNGNGSGGSNDDRDLQAMRERWAQAKQEAAKPRGSFAVEAEPGTYACVLEEAKFIKVAKGYRMSILNFKVADGSDQDGKLIPIVSSTESEEKFKYMALNLTVCGVPMADTDITDLPLVHEQLTVNRPQCEITVKDNEKNGVTYRNAYLNKLLAETTVEEEQDAPAEEPPAPVPPKGRARAALAAAAAKADAAPAAADVAAAPVAPPRKGRGKAVAAPAPVEPEVEVEDAEAIVEEEVEVDQPWEAGDDVQFTLGGKAVTGVIKSIGDDGRLMVRQDGTGKSYWVDPAKDKNLERMAAE